MKKCTFGTGELEASAIGLGGTALSCGCDPAADAKADIRRYPAHLQVPARR
jgi:hypothetical protein